jgi:hypothetical protein
MKGVSTMSDKKETDLDLDAPLWGAEEIAPVIKRKLHQTYHLLERGHLPATKVGGTWTSTLRRLRSFFGGEVE